MFKTIHEGLKHLGELHGKPMKRPETLVDPGVFLDKIVDLHDEEHADGQPAVEHRHG